MPEEEVYVCIVESSGTLYLLMDGDGNVMGGEKQRMLNYWTGGWEKGLNRGGTWGTSAMLSFIQVQPSIFPISGVEELPAIIGTEPPYEWLRLASDAMMFFGIRCEGDVARQCWEDGEKPQFFRRGQQ